MTCFKFLCAILIALASWIHVSPPAPAGEGGRGKPNIVIMMADDMGFSDLGCYGSEIRTPNIDRLAAGGLRFTQFYNTARCCPTRAALLTGLYSHQAGVGHMVGNLGASSYQGYLNDRCVTIAEALKPAGYRTLMCGKWHVGEDRPHWPTDRGFDRYFGLISGGSNYFKLDDGRKMALDDKPWTPPNDGTFYMTDAFTDHATRFLDEWRVRNPLTPALSPRGGEKGQESLASSRALTEHLPLPPSRGERAGVRGVGPFFLYLAFTSPHWPLHAWPNDIAKYRGKYRIGWDELRKRRHARMIELGIVDKKWPLTPRDPSVPAWDSVSEKDRDEWDLRMSVYAAQIDRMDQNVGRVLAKLKEIGADQNTLSFFLADNGGCAEIIERSEVKDAPTGTKESYRSYGVGWANASNTPFRLYKHWVHEGGISTPLIAHWPARLSPPPQPSPTKGEGATLRGGAITNQPGHLIDLMATCIDVAGAKYPTTFNGKDIIPLEGKSLLPILQGKKRDGHEAVFWEHEGNRAVRQGKWKLVSRHPGEWELYNLEADRTEIRNLAAQEPERVKELSDLYAKWAAKCGVQPWPIRRASR